MRRDKRGVGSQSRPGEQLIRSMAGLDDNIQKPTSTLIQLAPCSFMHERRSAAWVTT